MMISFPTKIINMKKVPKKKGKVSNAKRWESYPIRKEEDLGGR